MLSREELTKLLADEYGIHNERELDEALKKVAINIAIFTKPVEVQNGTRNIQEVS